MQRRCARQTFLRITFHEKRPASKYQGRRRRPKWTRDRGACALKSPTEDLELLAVNPVSG